MNYFVRNKTHDFLHRRFVLLVALPLVNRHMPPDHRRGRGKAHGSVSLELKRQFHGFLRFVIHVVDQLFLRRNHREIDFHLFSRPQVAKQHAMAVQNKRPQLVPPRATSPP
jgi:hypothetical protein